MAGIFFFRHFLILECACMYLCVCVHVWLFARINSTNLVFFRNIMLVYPFLKWLKSIMDMCQEHLYICSFCVQFKSMKKGRGGMITRSRNMLELQSTILSWKILNENTTTEGPKVGRNSQPLAACKKMPNLDSINCMFQFENATPCI